MKRIVLLAVMAMFVLVSCSTNDDVTLKDNYTFTTTLTTTCSPSISGYPQTTTSVTTQNGITAAQAKSAAESLTTTSTTTTGGYKITTTMKCVYILTKNYVAPPVVTGARVEY